LRRGAGRPAARWRSRCTGRRRRPAAPPAGPAPRRGPGPRRARRRPRPRSSRPGRSRPRLAGRAVVRALPGWWSRCSVRWGMHGGADGSCRRRPQDAGQAGSTAIPGPHRVRAVGEAVALVMAVPRAVVLAGAVPVAGPLPVPVAVAGVGGVAVGVALALPLPVAVAVAVAVTLAVAVARAGVLALGRAAVAVVASLGEGAVDPHDDRVVVGGAEGPLLVQVGDVVAVAGVLDHHGLGAVDLPVVRAGDALGGRRAGDHVVERADHAAVAVGPALGVMGLAEVDEALVVEELQRLLLGVGVEVAAVE